MPFRSGRRGHLQVITVPLTLTANSTTRAVAYVGSTGRTGRVRWASVGAQSAPASTLGTILLTLTKANASGTTNLLAAANFDLESVVADVPSTQTLSTTAGALDVAATDVIRAAVASNNADATGAVGLALTIGIEVYP